MVSAWAFHSVTPITGATIPIMDTGTEDGMILIPTTAGDMADITDILTMEVPTGPDTTTGITTVSTTEYMVMGDIIPKPITAMEEWIPGIMPGTRGLPEPLWGVPKQVLQQIPGTEAAPVKQLPVPPKPQLSGATTALPSVPTVP